MLLISKFSVHVSRSFKDRNGGTGFAVHDTLGDWLELLGQINIGRGRHRFVTAAFYHHPLIL